MLLKFFIINCFIFKQSRSLKTCFFLSERFVKESENEQTAKKNENSKTKNRFDEPFAAKKTTHYQFQARQNVRHTESLKHENKALQTSCT
jgi:hypothetical protein